MKRITWLSLLVMCLGLGLVGCGEKKDCPGGPYGELPTECDWSEYE